jgi:hypothetical protein
MYMYLSKTVNFTVCVYLKVCLVEGILNVTGRRWRCIWVETTQFVVPKCGGLFSGSSHLFN